MGREFVKLHVYFLAEKKLPWLRNAQKYLLRSRSLQWEPLSVLGKLEEWSSPTRDLALSMPAQEIELEPCIRLGIAVGVSFP